MVRVWLIEGLTSGSFIRTDVILMGVLGGLEVVICGDPDKIVPIGSVEVKIEITHTEALLRYPLPPGIVPETE